MMLRQVVYRVLSTWHGVAPDPQRNLGIGILGYAPSVGLTHGLAAQNVSGLELRAVNAVAVGGSSIVRLVTDDNLRAADVLREHHYAPEEASAVLVELPHRQD